jgi:DNA-binding NarL/FixJ family response regulator
VEKVAITEEQMDCSDILLVEDVPDVKLWLASLVHSHFPDSVVRTAESRAVALQAVAERPPCLALVDLGLPDGSGIDIIRALKRVAPQSFCVVTTIFEDSDHLFSALHAGADGYLLKDEPEEEFVYHLRGILAGRPPLSAAIARKILGVFKPAPEETVRLAPREEQVLTLIARGYSVRKVAEMLAISQHTVAGYLKTIYQKLQISSRAEATLKAIDLGLLTSHIRE